MQGVEFFSKFTEQDPEIVSIIAEALDHIEGTPRAICHLAENLLKVWKWCVQYIIQQEIS